MDTKQRKSGAGKTGQTGRRTSNQNSTPQRRRRAASAPARKKPENQKRMIREPKEDIPEAVYTMPSPLHRGKFLLRLISVVAVVLAMLIAVSIFFKVETVTVLGAEKYTAWQIREASGIQDGDGLLTLSKGRAAGKIKSALPYVDEVKISVSLPGTVQIEVVELDVAYAIAATNDTWWLMASNGKVIEQISTTAATGYTQILGVQLQDPQADQMASAAADEEVVQETQPEPTEDTEDEETGENEETQASQPAATAPTQMVQTNAQRLGTVIEILRSLESNGIIGRIVTIDVTNLTDIQMQYAQQLQVKLGTADRLNYKISYLAQAVKQMEEYQIGTLDLSFEFREDGIFTPEG